MVQHWLSLTVNEKSDVHENLVMVLVTSLGMFYTDDGIVGLKDSVWLQGPLNVAKSSTMTCQPGVIHTGMSEADFNQRITGNGATT